MSVGTPPPAESDSRERAAMLESLPEGRYNVKQIIAIGEIFSLIAKKQFISIYKLTCFTYGVNLAYKRKEAFKYDRAGIL